jgi:hypothetical protein
MKDFLGVPLAHASVGRGSLPAALAVARCFAPPASPARVGQLTQGVKR